MEGSWNALTNIIVNTALTYAEPPIISPTDGYFVGYLQNNHHQDRKSVV